ncbi:hypothetical protein MTO96_009231 [Rhipicephalus appendiculatus]
MLQAFTHESYPESCRIVPGYMRPMDFLGDALLKEMLTVPAVRDNLSAHAEGAARDPQAAGAQPLLRLRGGPQRDAQTDPLAFPPCSASASFDT